MALTERKKESEDPTKYDGEMFWYLKTHRSNTLKLKKVFPGIAPGIGRDGTGFKMQASTKASNTLEQTIKRSDTGFEECSSQ